MFTSAFDEFQLSRLASQHGITSSPPGTRPNPPHMAWASHLDAGGFPAVIVSSISAQVSRITISWQTCLTVYLYNPFTHMLQHLARRLGLWHTRAHRLRSHTVFELATQSWLQGNAEWCYKHVIITCRLHVLVRAVGHMTTSVVFQPAPCSLHHLADNCFPMRPAVMCPTGLLTGFLRQYSSYCLSLIIVCIVCDSIVEVLPAPYAKQQCEHIILQWLDLAEAQHKTLSSCTACLTYFEHTCAIGSSAPCLYVCTCVGRLYGRHLDLHCPATVAQASCHVLAAEACLIVLTGAVEPYCSEWA